MLQLPEGSILLERHNGIVLVFRPDSQLGRYVTWRVDADGCGVHSGNYFASAKRAAIDYEIRAGLRSALDAS